MFHRILLAALALAPAAVFAQTANLYTKPAAGAAGGLTGRVDRELTHAIALHHDHKQCFRAGLSDGGKAFRFAGLPTGKYDLVLVAKSGAVFEGLVLGEEPSIGTEEREHLFKSLNKADSFFNKWQLHRAGSVEGGEKLLLFVERIRDKTILKQSGEQLKSSLRRLEIAEMAKAADDWNFVDSRHIYREEHPLGELPFFYHGRIEKLGNVRVIDVVKDLGTIALPAN
jgi:hypothetical protein